MAANYTSISQLARQVPVFPLTGVILLPHSQLPLNIFEPRYLAMIDHVLKHDRLLGIVQPQRSGPGVGGSSETPRVHHDNDDEQSEHHDHRPDGDEGAAHGSEAGTSPLGKSSPLRATGAVGRLTGFQETDDGRYIISLDGVCRMEVGDELEVDTPFRQFNVDYEPFAHDLLPSPDSKSVDRDHLLATLKEYLSANGMSADWGAIKEASTEFLVNTLSMISPYGPEEKQALLEASLLKDRADVLIALAQMDVASSDDANNTTLQ